MSHRRAYWIAVALLVGSLLPLFLGDQSQFKGAWIGLVGSITGLVVNSADQLVGRAFKERERPWSDALLAVVTTGSLFLLWANFLYVDAWYGWWGPVILCPIAAGAVALPLLRWLGEPFPRIPYWTLVGVASGLSSSTILWAWKWNRARYDWDRFGPEELFVTSLALSPWVLGLPLVALLRLDRDAERVEPRRWGRTVLAGALIGLAHAEAWCLVRYDTLETPYSYSGLTASDAYEAALWGTLALLYGLGPTVISRLMGAYERDREPLAADVEARPGRHELAVEPRLPGGERVVADLVVAGRNVEREQR